MRSGGSALAIATIALVACACARHDAPAPSAQPAASAPSTPIVTVVTDAAAIDASPAPALGAWVDAIRDARWDDAWTALAALPDATQAQPEVRYAKARVAMERKDAKSALPALDGLDRALPLLADDVARMRAEAQLEAGPFDVAAEWFAARGGASSWLRAASAFEKAKLPARAKAQCDRVLGSDKRSRAQEADARATRMRVAPGDATNDDDARWLAIHAPDLAVGKDAEATLVKLAPTKPLTSDELLARAEAWSLAGKPDKAVLAIDRAAHAAGRKLSALEVLRAKGDALYRGGKYAEAARVLAQCAASGGPHVAEDAFRAARALARADKDDEAIVALRRVAKAHAGTTWGDQAAFLVGKLQLLHGRWSEAAKTLDAYVASYPNGQDKHEATRDRALARLLAGDAHGARPLFEQLAEDESDPLSAARARTMAALAALKDGDKTHAIARWTDVARAKPLSWPALVARARLAKVGAPVPPAIDPPEAPTSAPPLVITLPPPIDLLHRVGLDADAEGELHEREAPIASSAPPGRSVEALCDAYGQLDRARRRYMVAQQIPSSLLNVAPAPSSRWAWACAFPTPFARVVDERAKQAGFASDLVYAVMRQESGFDPDAVSPARAVGLLQLMPETAAKLVSPDRDRVAGDASAEELLGERLTEIDLNVTAGTRYLRAMLDRFHGALPLAVAAYNAGPEAIERWMQRPKGLDLDLFVERIPYAETRAYVARVLGNLARYAYLRGGDAAVPSVALETD